MSKSTTGAVPLRTVAMELRHSSIHVVVNDRRGAIRATHCRTYPWRQQAAVLNSDQGLEELTTAFEKIVKAENLQGQAVRFLLDGEYCVTRYVRGTEQIVNDRLDELEARCSRYLLLGHGRKLAARHIQKTDDGSVTGLLTVANQRTLETLSNAAVRTGIQLTSVTASIAVIGELVNRHYPTDCRAGLLIRHRQTGVDLAIIDNGQLLMDVHPVRNMDDSEICSYVAHRIALMQRFYQRNALSKNRHLQNLFFCGTSEAAHLLKAAFADSDLHVHSIAEQLEQSESSLAGKSDASEYAAVMAEIYSAENTAGNHGRPNLLEGLDRQVSRPLWQLLARTLWPVAAAVILGVLLSGLTAKESRLAAVNPEAIARHRKLDQRRKHILRDITMLRDRAAHLSAIDRQVRHTDISRLLTYVGSCLADDAGLAGISLQHDGTLKLQGSCPQEKDVYDFVDHLEKLPVILKASLSGTRSSETGSESRTEFNVDAIVRPVNGRASVPQYTDTQAEQSATDKSRRSANAREPNHG